MDNNNNWKVPAQGVAELAVDSGDWRNGLQMESRQRIVNKIMDTLRRHLPDYKPDGLEDLKKIAIKFEEKIYAAATSQSDYLRKISLKMLTMESKSQNTIANSLPSNSANNQGYPQQQLLPQNTQSDTTTTGLQASSGLTSTMAGGGGLPQTGMPSVAQNTSSQNMSFIGSSQSSAAKTMGQGVSTNMYANTQRQMQGRQILAQQQQQQQQPPPQNPQQIRYQQQLQQQYRHQYPQGNNQNSHIQLQQNLSQSSQQSVMQPNIQQNHQSPVQQSQSMLHQNPQLTLRQQPQLQPQSMLPQQQTHGLQPNSTIMHQNQLLGQQNSMSDMTQQRLLSNKNNFPNLQQQSQKQLMHQPPLGPQGNVSGLQQQQQVLGTQSGNSSMPNNQHPVHMLQQCKVSVPQQNQQNSTALPLSQGQNPQLQMPQQMSMPQIQSQPVQLQQQLGMQQQQNQLHGDMQQRLQPSGPVLQSQHMIERQNQLLFQSKRTIPEAPSSSLDSTAQTENANGGDWQEEVYQKIQKMKEAYLPELNEMYQKIRSKLQQHDTLPQQPKHEQLEKLKLFKQMLERIMTFLQVPRNNIIPAFKEKLGIYEKQIINFLNSNRPRKPAPPMQQPQQLPPSHMQQQQQSHIPQGPSHENTMSSQFQQVKVEGSTNTWQQNNVTNLQHNSLSSLSRVSNASQSMINPLQSNFHSSHGNHLNTMPQVAVGSIQQPVSAPQQPNSNMLQHQQLKQQEQQMLQNHQMKQKIDHMQQQMMHKQHFLQQQQQQQQQQMPQQTRLQQNVQLQAQQMPQLHQMNEMDLKMRQQIGIKGTLPQNQRSMYHQQQLKSGSSFPISSPQLLQSASPQMLQHASPQIDQQHQLPSLTKTGTPQQSANSPFIVPSPSTPLAPPSMTGDSDQATFGISPQPTAATGGHQQAATVTPAQTPAIGTPGISASPLLAEFTSPDGIHGNMSTIVSSKSTANEKPIDRLLKAVKSMSPNALSSSVSDIGSVVSMTHRIAGSAPGNGSRAAVGEDLAAMTQCRLQARNFITQDGNDGTRKVRRYTSAMPLTVASSAGSINTDNFKYLNGTETADLESTATSGIKRPRYEACHALLEEIKEINQRLIDTVVDVSDEDVNTTAAAASEGSKGTIVKCSYCAVALSANLKCQYASQLSPIHPVRLLVPANYPNSSPVLLDKFPIEVSKECEDLSSKAKSRFSISLRNLPEPMSLGEIARTWDMCARAVMSEYAQQNGGGSFSSKYGTWENCLSTA